MAEGNGDSAEVGEQPSDSEARLRLALSFGNLAVWEIDLEKRTVAPSPELNRLFGFPPDADPGMEGYASRYAPGERERVQALSDAAVARGDTKIDVEFRITLPGGEQRWLLMRAEAAPPVAGSGPRALGVIIDVTGSKRAEEALRQSELRFRLSQQAAGIASVEVDVTTGTVVGSDNLWALWGLSPRSSTHISTLESIVLPEYRDVRSTEQSRQTGTALPRVEYQIRRPDTGEIRWIARHVEFVKDGEGRPLKMFGVMQDITPSKAAEQRQALLTHELEHRIKNILATVSAIASQTLRKGDLDSARETFLRRIKALSEAHNLLTHTRWTDASLRGVLEAALAPHGLGNRFSLEGDDYRLNPRMALSLALAVNELATNAVKYGALSTPAGSVAVSWGIEPDEANGEAELIWRWAEQGGPEVRPPERRGFGSVLIERVLGADFGGVVTVDYAPAGVRTMLRVPASALPPQ